MEPSQRNSIANDRGTHRVGQEISLCREYRTRLIADVVTGKLDVREAAPRLPDEPGELEPLDESDAVTDGENGATDTLGAVSEEKVA